MLANISEEEGLEGWVQAKITKASDYLSSVKHHLEYKMLDANAQAGLPDVEMPMAPEPDAYDINDNPGRDGEL